MGGAKITAVVLHTMNIEGQIHQKNLGMGRTPQPPLSGNARILEAPGIAYPEGITLPNTCFDVINISNVVNVAHVPRIAICL